MRNFAVKEEFLKQDLFGESRIVQGRMLGYLLWLTEQCILLGFTYARIKGILTVTRNPFFWMFCSPCLPPVSTQHCQAPVAGLLSSKHPRWWLSSAKTQMLLYICVFLEIFYQEKIFFPLPVQDCLKSITVMAAELSIPWEHVGDLHPQAGEHWAPRKQSCASIPLGIEGFLSGLADPSMKGGWQ